MSMVLERCPKCRGLGWDYRVLACVLCHVECTCETYGHCEICR